MRVFRDFSALPDDARGAAIAIGNFDGLHRGHRTVLAAMIATARARGIPSAVLTFTPHPKRFFNPDAPPLALEPFHVRLRRLKALGVDIVYIARFNAALAGMTAEQFSAEILQGSLGARHIVTGANFAFGKDRKGNSALLEGLAKEGMFSYEAMYLDTRELAISSSSNIRAHLAKGEMGAVQHGTQRGAALGYPTANLIPRGLLLPAFGVFAARYAVAEPLLPEAAPASWKPAVAYLGTRPTYDGDAPWLEVHALDTPEPLYGRRLRVQLLAHLRPDARFASDAALQAQIVKDISQTKQVLESNHA